MSESRRQRPDHRRRPDLMPCTADWAGPFTAEVYDNGTLHRPRPRIVLCDPSGIVVARVKLVAELRDLGIDLADITIVYGAE